MIGIIIQKTIKVFGNFSYLGVSVYQHYCLVIAEHFYRQNELAPFGVKAIDGIRMQSVFKAIPCGIFYMGFNAKEPLPNVIFSSNRNKASHENEPRE